MFVAIQTRIIPATSTKPTRIKAYSERGAITESYDHALTRDQRHHAAAKALAEKFSWKGIWVYGGAPDGKGNVYVRVEPENPSDWKHEALVNSPAFAFEVK
jgi:hypothetical protein